MAELLKLFSCVCVYFMVLNTAECQVTVTNLNGAGNFLCGHYTTLECAIPGYGGGMTWKFNGTIVAQCVFFNCNPKSALPSGDTFTPNETAKTFNLNIGITQAINGTVYQCDDGSNQDQTTVNIQVPPSGSAFNVTISETASSITVEAGCFYPSDAGRMDVYQVDNDGTEKKVKTIAMTPTTTGCTGDCAGSNIYTATGSYGIDNSNIGGNSKYRFKMYHKDATAAPYVVSIDSSAIYNFEEHSTSPPTSSSTSPITTPPPGPDCGETCIIIIVVVVVGVVIFITIIIVCVRKRNKNEATKELAENNDKNDQNNIPLGEPVPVA